MSVRTDRVFQPVCLSVCLPSSPVPLSVSLCVLRGGLADTGAQWGFLGEVKVPLGGMQEEGGAVSRPFVLSLAAHQSWLCDVKAH